MDSRTKRLLKQLKRIDPKLKGCLILGQGVAEMMLSHYPNGRAPVVYVDAVIDETRWVIRDVLAPRGASEGVMAVAFIVVSEAFQKSYRELQALQGEPAGHA